MLVRGRQKPCGGPVFPVVPGNNDVDGAIIVELIDLVATGDDRNVPAKKIDEDPLALLEHGAKQAVFHGLRKAGPDVHDTLLLIPSGRRVGTAGSGPCRSWWGQSPK